MSAAAVLTGIGSSIVTPGNVGSSQSNPVTTSQKVNLLNSINMNTVLVSYSPIIITLCIILLSAFSQTMQGITFFLFLFLFSFIRIALIKLLVEAPSGGTSNNPDCVNFPIVSAYDNDGFNIFYITYLYGYIVTPMLTIVPMNYVLIIFLGIYLIYIFIQAIRSKCVSGGYVVGNFFYALISVSVTMSIITACKIETQLFLYDSVSDAIKCSMPSKQSFKCSVYQNGQLISSNTT